MQTLRQQLDPAANQDALLRQQLDEANAKLAELRARNDVMRRDLADLPRLRGEVGRLREQISQHENDPTALAAKSWLARTDQLKARLEQTPGAKIPEFKYLTDQDWLNAARNDLKTDEDYLRAMSGLRNAAETAFLNSELQPALKQYAQANNGQFPTDLSQLQQYFNPPVDESVLQRWEIAPHEMVPGVGVGPMIITQVAPVDADYDNRYSVGLNGWGTSGTQDWDPATNPEVVLAPALKAYMSANNGLEPDDPSQLVPYLTTPEQQTSLEKLTKSMGPSGARSSAIHQP
jgi:hypothetical protein